MPLSHTRRDHAYDGVAESAVVCVWRQNVDFVDVQAGARVKLVQRDVVGIAGAVVVGTEVDATNGEVVAVHGHRLAKVVTAGCQERGGVRGQCVRSNAF